MQCKFSIDHVRLYEASNLFYTRAALNFHKNLRDAVRSGILQVFKHENQIAIPITIKNIFYVFTERADLREYRGISSSFRGENDECLTPMDSKEFSRSLARAVNASRCILPVCSKDPGRLGHPFGRAFRGIANAQRIVEG